MAYNGLKIAHLANRFFEKFHLGDFYQPILPYLAARFQKILFPHSAIQACTIMEYNSII